MRDEVAHERAPALSTEPGHPVLHVGEEALAGLLAVVADVDADLDLRRDRLLGRVRDGGRQFVGIDQLTPRPASVQLGEGRRAGQAAGVGGEDAVGVGGDRPSVAAAPTWCVVVVAPAGGSAKMVR